MGKNILSDIPKISYLEPAVATNAEEFEKVVRSRRSVRVYDATPIPDEVVHKCIDLALLAPTSSNLQCWEFYRIKSPELRKKLNTACLNQNAARTAAELIVCVARTKTWKQTGKQNLDFLNKEQAPEMVKSYYTKIVPFIYGQGPLGLFGPIKKLIFFVAGFWRPVPRGPASLADMRVWAHKTTALACENLMLAFRAYGYDSCPMEGFDEVRVKKALKLASDAEVCMVVSAGKRAANGVYGPRIRFDKKQFYFEK